MLFVWEAPGSRTIWMKGMRFALDLVWLDADKRVVEITPDVPPQPGATDSQLIRYTPAKPAMYVVEFPAGDAARLGIEIGNVWAFEVGSD